MTRFVSVGTGLLLCAAAVPAVSQTAAEPASAGLSDPQALGFVLDTLFLMIAAILVMWMVAGFTMLEAGLVRSKNVAMQCAKNIGLFAVATAGFLFVGHALMFPGEGWIIPGLLGMPGPASLETAEGAARSGAATFLYQLMFCAATASIVSGTLAERLRLVPFLVFTIVLTAIIYPIQASWSWGGGFLTTVFGFKDLAGSTVVHVVGGTAAVAGAIVIGAREGKFVDGQAMPMPGSNLPLATLGTLILWMGWFGFTAGSHISVASVADADVVARILVNNNAAGAGGVLAGIAVSWVVYRQIDLTFMLNSALAGLVAITAEPMLPSPVLAMMIGGVAGAIVVLSVPVLERLRIDDVVGAVPVHLFCGVWGTMAVLLSNSEATFMGQLASVAIVIGFVFVASLITWIVLHGVMGARVSSESEEEGLDIYEMGQEGYSGVAG